MRQGQVFQCSLSRGLLSHGQILLIGRTSEIAGAFPPLVHRFPGQSHHSVLVALSTCPLRINVDKAVFLTQSVWLLTRYACSNPYDTSGMQSVLANVQNPRMASPSRAAKHVPTRQTAAPSSLSLRTGQLATDTSPRMLGRYSKACVWRSLGSYPYQPFVHLVNGVTGLCSPFLFVEGCVH